MFISAASPTGNRASLGATNGLIQVRFSSFIVDTHFVANNQA
jgi:hypothetical protein